MRRNLALLLVLVGSACVDNNPRPVRLQSFAVSLQDPAAAGSTENPLPFSVQTTRDFLVDITARDNQGETLSAYNGRIRVTVVPGEVAALDPAQPTLSGGALTGLKVTVRKTFGQAILWVEDASGLNAFAVGTSPILHFQNPTVRDVQEPTGSRDNSPLSGSIVTIDRGINIVVHVANNGFYVVDRDDTGFNSAFAFNFNRPEGLLRGEKLKSFGGTVSEFLGLTELGFPSWDVDRRCPTQEKPDQTCEEGEFCVNGACLGQECQKSCTEGNYCQDETCTPIPNFDPELEMPCPTEDAPNRTCAKKQYCLGTACLSPACPQVTCAEGSVCQLDGACAPNPNIPDPVQDPPLLLTFEMEKYEGGLVRFNNVLTAHDYVNCDSPDENPGANGNGICEFCRTCDANRNANGDCPGGGRCCPFGQVCNTSSRECTSPCNASRGGDGTCATGKTCCPVGNTCDEGARMCNGCTVAEKNEGSCDDACSRRTPTSHGGRICTNVCDFRQFGQYRVGLTDNGQWNGAHLVMVSSDTVPTFRPDAPENKGRTLSVTGVLRQVYAPGPIFILEARDECDIDGIERTRTDCATVR